MKNNYKYRKKYNISQIEEMRRLFCKGYAVSHIARKFDCWPNAVWNHVYSLDPPRKLTTENIKRIMRNSKLTVSQVKTIRKSNLGSNSIAEIYGISSSCALGILKGKTYRFVEGPCRDGNLEPLDLPRSDRKTDLKRGAKKGQPRSVRSGTLVVLAKKYNVKPCTIRRRILAGKIGKSEIIHALDSKKR